MSGRHAAGSITRPTPEQAATMATSGAAQIAHALAGAPLVHVRRPVRRARAVVFALLLLALLIVTLALWM